jgi:3-hydroxyisobutyrate dehydrogenase-like beta-hydroxyacid dehydrogenase
MQGKQEQVGFVGLGNMGQPMAQRLLQATRGELTLRVFDRRAECMIPLVEHGALRAADLGDVARPGGIVLSMVATDQEVLQIALGDGGVLRQLGTGGIHVSLSTVSPDVSAQLTRLYRQQGSAFVVATVLGRPDIVEAGTLSIFLAGEAEAKARVRPLLAALGQRIYDLGPGVQAANIAKIAYNFLISSAIEAMGEAAALVELYGLDRARFLSMLIESPLFQCTVYEQYGAAMIGPRDFSDNRFPVALGLKDVELAIQVGRQKGLPLPYAEVARNHLLAAQAAGRGKEDWSVFSEFARMSLIEALVQERS